MRRCRPLLGTFVEIDCDKPNAIDRAFQMIERVHRLMSAHEAGSELSLINRFGHVGAVEVSAETAQVIERAMAWLRLSDGAFDIVRAGAHAIVRGQLPRHADQPEPDCAADWRDVRLDGGTVSLARPACLDLGGIAKGYAVDLAVEALQAAGASSGSVNAGGDLRVFGDTLWPIVVVEPMQRSARVSVQLRNEALATSAGRSSSSAPLELDHLVQTQERWRSVTVRAPRACDADALTKIVWAQAEASLGLLRRANAEAFAIRSDGHVEPLGAAALAA